MLGVRRRGFSTSIAPTLAALSAIGRASTMTGTNPPSGGSGDFGGRTPTHYVATFANVSGASSDAQDMGAAAWAAATNSSTPVTLGTAIVRATAGNIVGCGAGTYTKTTGGTNNIPVWNATNSGTVGNPIIFQAQNVAVRSSTTAVQRSIVSNGDSTFGNDGVCTFGATGRNYIWWDGWYCSEATSQSQQDSGVAQLSGGTGSALKRCWIVGNTQDYTGSNHTGIWINESTGAIVENCKIQGIRHVSPHSNVGAIHMFGAKNATVRHNEIFDCDSGGYIKFDHTSVGFYGITVEYNYYHDLSLHAIRFGDPSLGGDTPNFARYNLIVNCTTAINPVFANNNANGPRLWTCENNTASNTTYFMFPGFLAANPFESTTLRNNLHVTGSRFFEAEFAIPYTTWTSAGYLQNYNASFSVTTWLRSTGVGTFSTPATCFATTGFDQNSTQLGTNPFVGGGDYRLSPGHAARTAGMSGGPVGCYITGSEEIGLESTV